MGRLSKYFIPTLFVLPMILHWILPWGTEQKLYFKAFGISFFFPDFFYIFYLIWYKSRDCKLEKLPLSKRLFIILLSIVFIIYCWINLIAKDISYIPDLIVNNMSFIWITLIYLLAPLSPAQIQLTKPTMVLSLLILVSEVLLFSLGIVHYTTEAGNALSGQDYEGVMRISTTIGAATGSALVIGLLGALIVTTYKFSSLELIFLFIWTSLGVYFTMSRGTSAVWTLFMIYFFYKKYLKHVSVNKKIKALFGAICLVTTFYYVGGFNPILNRYEHMERSGDASAGRDQKWIISLKMIHESAPWGYGIGQVMPEKAIEMSHDTPHHFAPHNVYTLIAIETGIIGLILFSIYLIILLTLMDYSKPLSIYIVLALLINANTESFLLDSEAIALMLFAVMTVTKFIPIKKNRFSYGTIRYKSSHA